MKREGLEIVWTHGEGRALPFAVAHDEMPTRMVWSADGSTLWTAPREGLWTAWDPTTGARLRESYLPEGTRVETPLPQMIDLVLGPVVRRNQRDRVIVAWAPDASRALTVAVHRDALTLRAADGSVLGEPEGCRRPAAFSPDGARIACCSFGDAPLVLLRADDATRIENVPAPLPLYRAMDLLWPTDDVVLVKLDDHETRDHRLVAYSLSARRVTWERPGRWFHVTSDGHVVTARDRDDTLLVVDLVTGATLRELAKGSWPRGPFGCGEPDTLALVEKLFAKPIRFSTSAHLTGVRVARDAVVVFHGWADNDRIDTLDGRTGAAIEPVPFPWAPPTEPEKRRARAMLQRPADFIDHRLVAPDGSFVLYAVSRNVTEVPDPDAGSVVNADMSLALWDREAQMWRWETMTAVPEYTLRYSTDRAQFELGADHRGILVTVPDYGRSACVYDVATGDVRRIGPGDVPSGLPPLAVSPSRRATLTTEGTRVELRTDGAPTASVDLEDDRAVAGAFFDDASFVVVTARGRTIRFNRTR